MSIVMSREQIRGLDRHAIDVCKVPSLVLMENAGRGAYELIRAALRIRGITRPLELVIFCGTGNNGGDGFVVARRALVEGGKARVFLSGPSNKLKGDAAANYAAWRGLGGDVTELTEQTSALVEDALASTDAIVDALLGTGLDRAVSGDLAALIERINRAPLPRYSLDIPSGLDANTGAMLGAAIRADMTVTFACPKLGLLTSLGARHTGKLHVVDIGIPASLNDSVGGSAWLVEAADVARQLTPRPIDAHKASAGRVFAIAGSSGKTGAALLVARGALRAGAGLVTICTFADAAAALDARVLEEMTASIDPDRIEASVDERLTGVDAVAIGPGLGLDDRARRLVEHVVLRWNGVKIVDADAITHFAGRADALARASGKLVLTPHPGELGRLLGVSAAEVEKDRFGALARSVESTGAVVLLKGPRTLVGAPGELPSVNPTGSPALATGGSGDVLSGITAAFACTLEPYPAAFCAAYLHGLAGERAAARRAADRGMLAREIADQLPEAIAALATERPPLTV